MINLKPEIAKFACDKQTQISSRIKIMNGRNDRRNLYIIKLQLEHENHNNDASMYVNGIIKDASLFPVDVMISTINDIDTATSALMSYNDNRAVDGIIIICSTAFQNTYRNSIINNLYSHINPNKDMDGLRATSKYTPCTARAIYEFLISLQSSLNMANRFNDMNITIINRSDRVGLPLANLLIKNTNGNVVVLHSMTSEEKKIERCKDSDIIITATGCGGMIDERYLSSDKPQLIIDIGLGEYNGKLSGDLNKSVYDKFDRSFYTPVNGGIGKITRLCLIENLFK